MVVDPESERQEARRAKRALLLSVVAAIAVAVVGWYGVGMLSESAKRAGIQPKKRAEAVAAKSGPLQVEARPQDSGEPEAAAAAPVALVTPAPRGRFRLPPPRILLDLAQESVDEHDLVTGALLGLAALPEGSGPASPEIADRVFRLLYEAYLNRREISVLRGHGKFVRLAAFNATGTMAVTASSDHTARLWDVLRGQEIAVLKGHDAEVWSAAFSPDGRRVMTVSFDKSARLWDVETGDTVAVLKGHRGEVNAAAFSPDGRRMLTASYDNTARVWDVASADTIAVLEGHESLIRSAAFSADGERVVTASRDGTARIWDAATGAQRLVLRGHTREVRVAAFSPDGRRVATASADGSARLWDAESGETIAVLRGHDRYVTAAYFSPDGSRVITAAWGDNAARLWDAETGTAIAVLDGHRGEVNDASYSADSRYIVTAGGDNTARIWDARDGAPLAVLAGHDNQVYTAAFSPNGEMILTASADGTARLWRAHDGIPAIHLVRAGPVSLLQFNDPRHLAVSTAQGKIEIWDTQTGEGRQVSELQAGVPGGPIAVTVDAQGVGRLVETGTEKVLAELPGRLDGPRAAVVDALGSKLATVGGDGVVRLYRVFSTLADLAAHLRAVLPRELTRYQRKELTHIANTAR